MSGVWFVVSVPTEKYEKKLGNPNEKKELGKWKDRDQQWTDRNAGIKKDSPLEDKNNRKNQPNGILSVEVHNDENERNRSEDTPIIPTSPPSEKKSEKKGDNEDEERSLVWHLKDCLDKLAIFDAVWIVSCEDTFYQVFFPCEGPGVECDFVLQSLQNRGIGERGLSTVGIMPCDVFCRDYGIDDEVQGEETEDENGEEQSPEKKGKGFKAMQKEFLKSVTARLTVAQVVERVRSDAALSFDFIMFVGIASCIAALGLSENSSIIIVAAMLISPIMGPIMAFTFGLTIRDKKLIYMALKTELIGLSLCLMSGFLFGFICGNFSETWGAGKWPTPEMAGRGNVRSLWAGCLIALPSGAGVAISVLKGNGASLVGVAISASLLPPTVNCGLLWGLGAIKTVRGLYQHNYVVYDIFNHTVKPALLPPDTYTPTYYPLMDKECAVLGIISFLLTVVNIICIIIAALLILKVKEVSPHTTDPAVSRFWKHDVKIARDYNKTLGNAEGEELGKQFLQEWANLNGLDPESVMNTDSEEGRLTQLQTLMDIVEDAQEDDVFKSIAMNVPAPAADKVTRRLSIMAVGLGDGGDGELPKVGRRPSLAVANKQIQMKRRRQSKAPSIMDAVAEDSEAPVMSNVPRKSVVYNRSLQNADNPYSLWPGGKGPGAKPESRFAVSPVIGPMDGDELPPLPVVRAAQRRRRNSCFPTGPPGAPHPTLTISNSTGSNPIHESTAF